MHCQGALLFFSKWKRKSYSLFQTLKKVVAISVLPIIYFSSVPIKAMAVEKDTTEVKMQYELEEIEVSAQRSPVLFSQVARVLSVIERKEIEAAPAQNLNELLEYIPGVDVRQRGAEGVQADISIRGGTFDQTLILLNGINITDPQTGHHNLNLPVSLSQIERIEILEGPAARVYGPNAFSGAVNIITLQEDKSLARASVSGGSFGFLEGNLSANVKTGKVSKMLAFNGKKSDGYIENTDFGELNGFYSNRLQTVKGDFGFQAGISGKGFGANSFYTPKFPNQYEETKTFFTSAKWEGKGNLHLTPSVYFRKHFDRFELFRDDPPSWYKSHNYHQTNVAGANLNSWLKWSAGKTAYGAEYRLEQIFSNVLGKEMEEPKDVPGAGAKYTRSDRRQIISIFFEHAVYLRNWTLTGGVMANHVSGDETGVRFFPGLDMGYAVSGKMKIFASFNTSLRMPTFTDLYYDGPTNVGNPELKPEKSATIEGGIKWNSGWISSQAVVFHRRGKDIIDWVKYHVTDEVWTPENLTQVNSSGIELNTQFLFNKKFGTRFPELQINYLFNQLDKRQSDFISNYVLDNLKHKLVTSVSQQLIKNISVELKMVFQDRNGTFTLFEDKAPVGEKEYEPIVVFDAKLLYRKRGWSVFVSANNLTNRHYFDIGNVVQPGRWIKTGIAYSFDFK